MNNNSAVVAVPETWLNVYSIVLVLKVSGESCTYRPEIPTLCLFVCFVFYCAFICLYYTILTDYSTLASSMALTFLIGLDWIGTKPPGPGGLVEARADKWPTLVLEACSHAQKKGQGWTN